MPSTYDRLVFLEREKQANRLPALYFSPDGPQALLPALPDMIRLIEEVWRHQPVMPATVAMALAPLIEQRP